MPSLDAAAQTPALTTIDESLDKGQRDPRGMARAGTEVPDGARLEFVNFHPDRWMRNRMIARGWTPPPDEEERSAYLEPAVAVAQAAAAEHALRIVA